MSSGETTCSQCRSPMRPGKRFCGRCGHPASDGPEASLEKRRDPAPGDDAPAAGSALLAFLALCIVAYFGRRFSGHSLGVLLLLAALAALVSWFRSTLVHLLLALERAPVLRPWWAAMQSVPRAARQVAAFVLSAVVAAVFSEILSNIFGGAGFLVLCALLAINVPLSYALLREPPR